MLHHFTIEDDNVYVYISQQEALCSSHINTSFIISLEDLTEELHCDQYTTCEACPLTKKCDAHTRNLPLYVISTYAPHLIEVYPEYFI